VLVKFRGAVLRIHFVELLRGGAGVWIAVLMQAALDAGAERVLRRTARRPAVVLAIGNELQLGTYLDPARVLSLQKALRARGNSRGVYLLSQACVVVTYWAVFSLGRSIVGAQHAALAVLRWSGSRRSRCRRRSSGR
jgi:hypothetical protein